MKDCSICKYCDEDFDFDKETGEEYPVYECQKGMIHHLTVSARILRNTSLENIKRKIPNAIYANTEKNAQNIVPG